MTIPVIATIDEVEYNINAVDIKYSICKSSGVASFGMDIIHKDTIITFNDVEISVGGEPIFTGVIESITTGRFPDRMEIQASCEYIKAERTWFAEEFVSTGQTVSSWAGRFLAKAQVNNRSVSIPPTTVYPGHSWGFQTCHEALVNLAQIVNARIYPDRQGVIHFTPPHNEDDDGIDHTIEYYSECNKFYTNRATRNKVTVFGFGVSATRFGGNEGLPPGPPRHIAISSSLIHLIGTAEAVVNQILSVFIGPMEIYTYEVEGRPTMSLNDVLEAPDDTGPITSLSHNINAEGFTTTVTIGEICPNFFGMDIINEPYMYLSGTNLGVWVSDEEGTSWTNISGTTLANTTVPAIHSDATYLWAITNNNIYKSASKDGNWTLCSILPLYHVSLNNEQYIVEKANLELVDIITNLEDSSRCFVVAYDTFYEKTIVLFSEDLYNFNRIFMV